MTDKERLREIAKIIEGVDNRCAAVDGPVTPTLQEMSPDEIREIYSLASQQGHNPPNWIYSCPICGFRDFRHDSDCPKSGGLSKR